MNSKRIRSGAIYALLLIALGAFLYTTFARRPDNAATTVPIADVAEMVREGDVSKISVKDDKMTVLKRQNGENLQSRKRRGYGAGYDLDQSRSIGRAARSGGHRSRIAQAVGKLGRRVVGVIASSPPWRLLLFHNASGARSR